jgi:hypothetical protein
MDTTEAGEVVIKTDVLGRNIYTVIESRRRRGLDPYSYLRDVLTRLPQMTNHQLPQVTPAAWAKRTAAVL